MATLEAEMRGIDYRARKVGICLLVARPFSSKRELSQGLMRIGRFEDNCERLKLSGFDLIDRKLEIESLRKIVKFR